MAYIDPRFWDDPVADLDSDCVRLWMWLMTGQNTHHVPGLVVAGLATVAEQSKLDHLAAQTAVARLIEANALKFDKKLRLFRVVNGPHYCLTPSNGFVIRSWFSKWEKFPESALKYEHVESLAELAMRGTGEGHKKAWSETFGRFSASRFQNPESSQQSFGFGTSHPPSDPPSDLSPTDQDQDQNGINTRSRSPDPTASEPKKNGGKGNKKNGHDKLNGQRAECERLWALHNRLRREVIPGVRNLAATEENLGRIAERLAEGHTVEDCEHMLFARAAEIAILRRKNAKDKLEQQVRFFNGATPWRSNPFEMYMAMPTSARFREEVEARWRHEDAQPEQDAAGGDRDEPSERQQEGGVGASEALGMSITQALGIDPPPAPKKEEQP